MTPVSVDWDDDVVEKGGYETFMLKEIHEQRAAVADTLAGWIDLDARSPAIGVAPEQLRRTNEIVIVGCGTSYHAALAGRIALERWARVPVETDLASEFRHRDPLLAEDSLVIGITQSGETADTLAAMRLARARGATVLALTNVPGSQATREADGVAVHPARGSRSASRRRRRSWPRSPRCTRSRCTSPSCAGRCRPRGCTELSARARAAARTRIDAVLASVQRPVRELAERLAGCEFFLYLGRLAGLPVALEGALKLKEVSYIPTDAYAAGEMKHGPIALLGEQTPVVCVATDPDVLDKMLSNISEVRARGARVFAIATEGSKEVAEHAEEVVYIPADRRAAADDPRDHPAAAAGLPHRARARAERRPAAQPGKDSHGRVAATLDILVHAAATICCPPERPSAEAPRFTTALRAEGPSAGDIQAGRSCQARHTI